MQTQNASPAEDHGGARNAAADHARRFPLCLPLGYYVSPAGGWGTGVTRRISRSAVEFVPSDSSIGVGDVLHYVLVFPGSGGEAGAVASCRGQVIQAGTAVVVTIDQQRLQAAATARTARSDARRRWLADLCEAARLGRRAAAGPAAGRGLSDASPA